VGVVKEAERDSERVRGRPNGSAGPVDFWRPASLASGWAPPALIASSASVHRRCRMMDFVAHWGRHGQPVPWIELAKFTVIWLP